MKNTYKKTISTLCAMLIAFAPMITVGTASILFFGEPKCPDCLNEEVK